PNLTAGPVTATFVPYTTLFRSDHAIGHGQHRVALAGMEVDALVEAAATAERIGAAAVAGGDVGIEDRHARRGRAAVELAIEQQRDRKSTRLNSSHVKISYAVFC